MIKIDDTHFITADTHSFMLQEKRIVQDGKNKGEEYIETLGFYSSIENAIKGLMKNETRKYVSKKETSTLKEAIKELENIENKILSIKYQFRLLQTSVKWS